LLISLFEILKSIWKTKWVRMRNNGTISLYKYENSAYS
jgi:hypothetical protein